MSNKPELTRAFESREAIATRSPKSQYAAYARTGRRRLFTLTVLLGIVAIPSSFVWREYRQERRNQALIAAIKRNDTKAVLHLLDEGADANARDQANRKFDGWQAFKNLFVRQHSHDLQVEEGIPAIVVGCIPTVHHGATNDWYLDRPDNAIIVKALLDHGADPNPTLLEEPISRLGPTDALTVASNGSHALTVGLILEHGADPNHGPNAGQAIYFAAAGEHVNTLRCLIAHGADINCWNQRVSMSPLEAAVCSRQIEAVRFLLSHGADVSAIGNRGHSLLGEAKTNKHIEMISLLKQYGATP